MQIYRVGGYVRDKLLGLKPTDCDYLVVGSTPSEMLSLGYTQVGVSFPVFLHPLTHEEYALARNEKKSGHGYYGFETTTTPHISLEEDLQRRDLTINAIAEDINGNIIDPYGGIQDLNHRQLRHISPAFKDDPLRILRVARFAATLDFTVAPETMNLLKQMAIEEEGKYIVRERIIRELDLVLAAKHSINFFDVLQQSNNLSIFFPALTNINNLNFSLAMKEAKNKNQKYTLLAISLPQTAEALSQVALSRDLRKYLQFTQFIYKNLQFNLSNEQILELLKCTGALREFNNFKQITNNLIWLVETLKLNYDNLTWLYHLIEIASILTAPPTTELINGLMSKHDIIKSINTWQLKTIQQIRDCKC